MLNELSFDHSSSVMVALLVPSTVKDQLVRIGAYDPDDERTPDDPLHVTLVYLGKEQRSKLDQVVQAVKRCVVRSADPMTATITGFGKFNKGEEGIPYFALVSCKGLEHLKVDLERALLDDGLAIPSEHGFVPHMTLGYDDDDPKLPSLDQPIEWKVTEVTIVADDNKTMILATFSSSVESMIERVVAGEQPYEVIL